MTGRSSLNPKRIRPLLEWARNRRFFQHERDYERRELDFLDLLIRLVGFFVVLHTLLHLFALGVALSAVPLVISLPPLVCAIIFFRTQHYQAATEAILLTCALAFAADVAFDSPFGIAALGYLLVPLVIGVLLLSPRSLALLVAADVLLVVIVGWFTLQNVLATVFLSMLSSIVFASALALLVKRYLHAVDADHRVTVAENESIFHTLITNMPVFLVVLDKDGIITMVEGEALDRIPFDAGSFIGRSVYDAYRGFPEIMEDCRRALEGEVLNSTVTFGDLVLDVWYSPLTLGENERAGMIAVATDVTERRRAEEVLQEQASLLQSVSDAIISVDTDFNIQTWNRGAETIYGWYSFDVIGRPIDEVIETDRPANWQRDALAHVTDEGEWQCELHQKGKDGQELSVLASFSPLEDATGETRQMIIVARDIAQRKQAEQQSLELALEREKAKLLREFIGDSSHDFRTPLTTIRTSAYLLRVKNPGLSTKHLDVIETEVDHMSRLVEDLLTLARLDQSIGLELAPVDISALISQVMVPLQLLAEDKKQTLTFEGERRIIKVMGDSMELERVFVNVLTNAVSYTGTDGTITIRAACNDKTVVITVSDSGVGISAEDLPHIFERFFRVDKTRGTRTGGAGLGLPIAKKIIEAHHGTIEAASTLGEGTTFTIKLPLI